MKKEFVFPTIAVIELESVHTMGSVITPSTEDPITVEWRRVHGYDNTVQPSGEHGSTNGTGSVVSYEGTYYYWYDGRWNIDELA